MRGAMEVGEMPLVLGDGGKGDTTLVDVRPSFLRMCRVAHTAPRTRAARPMAPPTTPPTMGTILVPPPLRTTFPSPSPLGVAVALNREPRGEEEMTTTPGVHEAEGTDVAVGTLDRVLVVPAGMPVPGAGDADADTDTDTEAESDGDGELDVVPVVEAVRDARLRVDVLDGVREVDGERVPVTEAVVDPDGLRDGDAEGVGGSVGDTGASAGEHSTAGSSHTMPPEYPTGDSRAPAWVHVPRAPEATVRLYAVGLRQVTL